MRLCKILLFAIFCVSSGAEAAPGRVTGLDFKPGAERSTFILSFSGQGRFRMLKNERNNSVVLEADNLALPPNLSRAINAAAGSSPVLQITPYAAGDKRSVMSKIVFQMRQRVDVKSTEVPGKFLIEIKRKSLLPDEPTQVRRGWSETDRIKTASAAGEKGEEAAKRLVEVLNAPDAEKVYSGSRVTFEAEGASVHDVFRLVGEASGLNIISESRSDGRDNYSLKDIPWDQLLDVVVSKNQLKAKVAGNLVYIVTQEQFAMEQDEKLKALTAADAMEPVVMAVIPLSYASATEMKKMIESLLVKREGGARVQGLPTAVSVQGAGATAQAGGLLPGPGGARSSSLVQQDFERGKIELDERSNSLVVTNTKEAVERIRRLVKELDVALPQVLIDAKIIIATDNFSKSVGVQWGG